MLENKAWFQEFRPSKFEDLIFPNEVIAGHFNRFKEMGYIDGNILMYSNGGFGKTSTIGVFVRSIIQNENDIYKAQRKVDDIDNLKGWINRAPSGSRQKIVIMEEFDTFSDKTLLVLKDELLEKYIPKTIFLATTNKLDRIKALDPEGALQGRFTYKFNFNITDNTVIYNKLAQILVSKGVTFIPDELLAYVDKYKFQGLREMINTLQLSSLSGTFQLANLATISMIEKDLFEYTKYLINYALNLDINTLQQFYLNPRSIAAIAPYYDNILQLIMTNDINYDAVLKYFFMDKDIILPIQKVLHDYYNTLQLSKNNALWYISFFGDSIKTIIELKT